MFWFPKHIHLIIMAQLIFLQGCSLAPEAEFTYSIVLGKKPLKDKKVTSKTGSSAFVPKEAFDTEAKVEISAAKSENISDLQNLSKEKVVSSIGIQTKSTSGEELSNPKSEIEVCLVAPSGVSEAQMDFYESSHADKKITQIQKDKISKVGNQFCVKTKVTNGDIFITKKQEAASSVSPVKQIAIKSFKFFDGQTGSEKKNFAFNEKTQVYLRAIGENDLVLETLSGLLTMSFVGPATIEKQQIVFDAADKGQKSIEFLFAAAGSYEISFELADFKSTVTILVAEPEIIAQQPIPSTPVVTTPDPAPSTPVVTTPDPAPSIPVVTTPDPAPSTPVVTTPSAPILQAVPSEPTGGSTTVNSITQITLNWSSGGGTTAGYRISYQSGATAPASCATGTTIAENNITGTSKAVSGLSNATQYSFRICSINANPTPDVSSGITVTGTTLAMPVITVLADSLYPIDGANPPLVQGASYTLASAADADGDTITLTCTYQTLDLNTADSNYAVAGTNCNALSTLNTTNSVIVKSTTSLPSVGTSPSIVWKPTSTQRGTYRFTFDAVDSTSLSATTKTIDVTVRENITTSNMLSAVDAAYGINATGLSVTIPSAPNVSSSVSTNFINLLASPADGALTFGSATPWSGTGISSSPYALNFTSANSDSFSLSNVLNGQTRFGLSTWVKPTSPTTANQVIASNGGGSGNGFVLRQSSTPTGKAEFVVGQKYYSYKDIVLRDKPVGYWRLDDTNATALDLSAYGIMAPM